MKIKVPKIENLVPKKDTETLLMLKTETMLKTLYLESLSEKELKSYAIAKSHLGMSFQLEKSHGYLEWKKKHILYS
jgi:hypothetical protein